MCKRVLSRGSERTLAGRTRGCGGLLQEEIQEVGGPEEKSESQYRDWRRDEISLEKLWCMKEGLIKGVVGEKQGRWFTVLSLSAQQSEGSIVKTVIITVFTLTTKLTQWLTMVHVTAHNGYTYLLNLITVQIDTDFIVHQLVAVVRLPRTHLSTRHRAKGVGWPHHRLGVHHGGRIHHPHGAHLWRLQCVAQRWETFSNRNLNPLCAKFYCNQGSN